MIRNEEERFLETLARGLVLFEEEATKVRAGGGKTLPVRSCFVCTTRLASHRT